MAVACPYCQFTMSLKGAKPGRYTPACQQCKKKFLIIVTPDAPEIPTVKTWEEGVAEAQRTLHPPESKPSSAHPKNPAHASATRASSVQETIPPAPRTESHAPLSASLPHQSTITAHATSELTGALGGYTIERKIGEGGMGAVYLARQVSLDRPVAVKVMNSAWANDPAFIARFTREAYAAAQLTHHNIVQIYDIGIERDVHFFSMEFVPGKTLSQIVHDQGRIDPEVAAGYTLQAARGLKFAHDHGMIHRDIKPENLLLNEQGIVKVLDLGLVKTPNASEALTAAGVGAAPSSQHAHSGSGHASGTQLNVSMGTPAYMSPEQAQDAANVDPRADVYSLGCTLYDLVVGKPPFEGKTVIEVLTKHASEPLTPPDVLVKRVPPALSAIVQQMVAKKKEDRYSSMDGVIRELEEFLGISSTGPFSPREEHASLLERAVETFNKSPLAGLRKNVLRAFFLVNFLLIVIFLFFGPQWLAGGLAGLIVLSVVSYQIMVGIAQKTHVFTRLRQLAFGARFTDWLKFIGLAILSIFVLWIFGLLWIWIGVAVAAVGLSIAWAIVLDALVRKQRKPSLDEVRGMLKSMRLKGLEEEALRQFVCKYSGKHWEEFYEALFGYEAKMQAREAWGRGEGGRARKKFASWRDSFITWADARMKKRSEARERALLEKLEEKSLRARGTSEVDAKRKAKQAANWMVDQAVNAQEENRRRVAETAAPSPAVVPVVAMRFDQDPDEKELAASQRERDRVRGSANIGGSFGVMILGPHIRLFLGVIALVVCLLWLHQNDSLHAERVRYWVSANVHGAYHNAAEPWKEFTAKSGDPTQVVQFKDKMQPLKIPFLTPRLSREQNWQLFNSLAWGIGGILLILAAFYRGVKISLLIIPAAFVMISGGILGIPGFWKFGGWQLSYLIGGVLAFLAFYLGKERA